MPIFSSKSKSSSKTYNVSQTGEGGAEVGIGSRGNDLVSLSNIGQDVELTITEGNTDVGEIESLLTAVAGTQAAAANNAAQQVLAANATVAEVARTATGAESELGRMVSKFGLPILVIVVLFLVFKKR